MLQKNASNDNKKNSLFPSQETNWKYTLQINNVQGFEPFPQLWALASTFVPDMKAEMGVYKFVITDEVIFKFT
jgi:hypothetical protein